MVNANIREAHKLLDGLFDNSELSHKQIDLIRGLMPELPKQKTLEEIAWDLHFAWTETVGNHWEEALFGDLETWLSEQHNQLRDHLEGVKGEDHPEFLETEADYENAPERTVVTRDGTGTMWMKHSKSWASTDGDYVVSCPDLSVGRRRVLRWDK